MQRYFYQEWFSVYQWGIFSAIPRLAVPYKAVSKQKCRAVETVVQVSAERVVQVSAKVEAKEYDWQPQSYAGQSHADG